MKKTLLTTYLLFLIFLSATAHAQQKPGKKMDIYILMGQSNMAGRGKITAGYKELQHPRVMMLKYFRNIKIRRIN